MLGGQLLVCLTCRVEMILVSALGLFIELPYTLLN